MVAVIGVLASTGVSFLLAGIADALHHDLGTTIAIRQAAAPWTVVYGRARVGGTFTYISETGTHDKQLHMVVVHCKGPVQAIGALYLDGKQVIMGAGNTDDGNAHYDASGVKYNFKGKVYWETRLGTDAQSSFASLTAIDPNYPSTATLSGHACSYIRLTYDSTVFPNGMPGIRVDIVGKNNVYDPRTASNGYTENWALCINDVLCNSDYGLQCNYGTEVDEAQLIAAANICDESVALANGDHEPRYTINGSFTTELAPGDILSSMLTAAAGRMTYVGGIWKIYPAAWVGPSLSLSDADLLGQIKWIPRRKYRDLVNGVKGTFICPSYPYISAGPGLSNNQKITGIFDGQWRQTDVPPYMQDTLHGYASDANYASDGNTRLWLDTRFPFTISIACAQRLMKILLMRNRQQGTGTIVCRISALRLQVLDVIHFSHLRWASQGFTNKLLEISNFRLNFHNEQGKAPSLSIELDLQESDPSVYEWSSSEELGIEDNPPPKLPNSQNVDTPGSLALESGPADIITSADGIKRTRIKVTWSAPNDGYVTHGGEIELQVQPSGATTWNPVVRFAGDATEAYIDSVNDGQLYNIRIRSASVTGAYSDWVIGSVTASNSYSTFSSSSTTSSSGVVVTGATPTAAAGQVAFGSSTSAGGAVPATSSGNLIVNVDGVDREIPYY